MADEYHLTQHAHDQLHQEHTHLTTVWRIEIARKIETARELGDLSENGDYHAAKEEQGKTEARIAHLGALLENAVIIQEGDGSSVQVGSRVTITYEGDEHDFEEYLVGRVEEAQAHGVEVISPDSPLGKALLGAAVGDEVAFAAPAGELKITVRSIEG
jgi:transcription elongation factor GreA